MGFTWFKYYTNNSFISRPLRRLPPSQILVLPAELGLGVGSLQSTIVSPVLIQMIPQASLCQHLFQGLPALLPHCRHYNLESANSNRSVSCLLQIIVTHSSLGFIGLALERVEPQMSGDIGKSFLGRILNPEGHLPD